MKPTTILGLLFVLIAMIVYTIGTFSAFKRKAFRPFNLVFLWVGVVFDILATYMMWLSAGGHFVLSPTKDLIHTILALTGFAGMLLFTLLGTWSYAQKNEGLQRTAARLIVAPWAVWAISFVWGMVSPPKG